MQIRVIFNSTVDFLEKIDNGFEVIIQKESITVSKIVIATGVSPNAGSFKASESVLIGPGNQIQEFNFTNKKVAILGGGDNAAENYTFIKDKNPDQCHIYARTVRSRPNLWGSIDPSDRFVGKYKADQQRMSISYNAIEHFYDVFVVLYGWEANIPHIFEPFRETLLDEKNFIITDELRKTNISAIFAAGEVTQRIHPCVATSMADGVIAATAIQSQFENKGQV